jgi:hypothetical protein
MVGRRDSGSVPIDEVTPLTSIVGEPGDLYVGDACGSGDRAVLGVTDQPLVARLRLVTAMLSMPEIPAYGVIRSARLDPMAGYPRYVYVRVLVRVRRGAAGMIEAADDC